MAFAKHERYPWLWDVDMDNATFDAILHGQTSVSGLDADWAMVRLIEYAPYTEIKRLLPLEQFLQRWPTLMPKIRAASRREGMAFLATWMQRRGKYSANHVHGNAVSPERRAV